MELYKDQSELMGLAHNAFNRHRSICLVMPTGAGKTVVAAHIARAASRQGRLWFLVHRRELMDQAQKTLEDAGLRVSLCAAGKAGYIHPRADAVVAMASTLIRRGRNALPKPYLIVVDEAHHARAKTWETILGWHPEAYKLGLTATPQRLDNKGLGDVFGELVEGLSTEELIAAERLSSYRIRGPAVLYDRASFKTTAGDFNARQMDQATSARVIGAVAETILEHCRERTTLVFSVSVRASKELVKKLQAQGVKAVHLDGESESDYRKFALRQWAKGGIQVVSNVSLFSEGMDAPACDALVLARPTKSITVYLQQVGRVLRYQPGKRAEIFDLAGNCRELGLPADERQWDLAGVPATARQKAARRARICRNCAGAFKIHLRVCPYCGEKHEPEEMAVREVKSNLLELTSETLAAGKRRSVQTDAIFRAAYEGASDKQLLEKIKEAGYRPGFLRVVRSRTRSRGRR